MKLKMLKLKLGLSRTKFLYPKGFHEGSDEVMLALYKLNEVTFKAMVVYPFKVLNFESDQMSMRKIRS